MNHIQKSSKTAQNRTFFEHLTVVAQMPVIPVELDQRTEMVDLHATPRQPQAQLEARRPRVDPPSPWSLSMSKISPRPPGLIMGSTAKHTAKMLTLDSNQATQTEVPVHTNAALQSPGQARAGGSFLSSQDQWAFPEMASSMMRALPRAGRLQTQSAKF